MPYRFLSKEYLEEAARRLREDSTYQDSSRGFDDTVCFIVDPDPEHGVDHRFIAGMMLPSAEGLWVDEEKPASFTFSAPYGVFTDIMTGVLDPVRAMTQRKLRVAGSMPKLLRYVKGTQALIGVLRTIPTEFEGEYAAKSFGD